ncbi:protein of unknown function [Bradyrhizobium vignae]|uniref:Uncharacterized protein n=1 Tax=Bradyrhizobium vignae TaxID=1549949 RepID=A0A2U3Q129_9BRAD|nr:protein of unknown function [Bradyrhizobium vignae]
MGRVNVILKALWRAVRYSPLPAAVTTTLGALLFISAARAIRDGIGRAPA